jgi:hypothetical protein
MTILPILWEGHEFYIFIAMAILVSIDSLLIWLYYLKKKEKTVGLYLINFFTLYLILVGSVYFYDKFIEYKLSAFDLDHDSFFSKEEQTPDQIKYMQILTNNISRNLMVITGAIYSFISTIILFIVLKIFEASRKQGKQRGL